MAPSPTVHDKNILIVDDNVTNILLMQAILEEEGYANTFAASTAFEAYELLEREEIHAILMDIVMPEIDGLEATQAIHANEKYQQIPIIMVTAIDDDTILKKSFEYGAVDFVRKPVNQVELIVRLQNVLRLQEKDNLIMQHSRFDAMGEIIGMLAHQWRQPLSIINAIISTIQTQRELGILNDDDLTISLENIVSHTNELSHMITTFREFFKTESTPSLANPNTAINESLQLLQESLEREHISINLDLGELEPIFYAQNLLIQVLTSIITNAKEAHQRNKTLQPYITICSFKQSNKINILVEDNAGGIDKEHITHIFEPYFTTKKEKNGKGLGLYLSKNIVSQQLGGKISVTSQEGKSKFLITFNP